MDSARALGAAQLSLEPVRLRDVSASGDPGPLTLTLHVTDPEVIAELRRHGDGYERDRHALSALRVGMLALRAASGQMDVSSIREAGGADYSIARLLAQREIVGPRLFYSGRALTQTGGGADFRTPYELTDPCGHVSPFSVMSVIADGVDELRKAAREELRRGASQIKLFASGGVV